MTDPLEACLQELNEAVSNHGKTRQTCNKETSVCPICEASVSKVIELRHKYNAMVIAYSERTD